MPVNFPAVNPSEFRHRYGEFPVKNRGWKGGIELAELKGSVATGHTLDLFYANIADTVALQFLQAHENARLNFDTLTLPAATVSPVKSTALAARIRTPRGCRWRFAEHPTLRSVAPGYSEITVRLIARITTG